jgi:hypothetical protein
MRGCKGVALLEMKIVERGEMGLGGHGVVVRIGSRV